MRDNSEQPPLDPVDEGNSQNDSARDGTDQPQSGKRYDFKVIREPGESDRSEGEATRGVDSAATPGRDAGEHRVKPDLRSEQLVKGSHPGDRFIRYDRNVGPFRRKGGGVLAASLAAEQPRS